MAARTAKTAEKLDDIVIARMVGLAMFGPWKLLRKIIDTKLVPQCLPGQARVRNTSRRDRAPMVVRFAEARRTTVAAA